MPFVEYDEVQAICSDCGRIFPSEETLSGHRGDAHGGRVEPEGPLKAKSIECSVCHERFRSTAALSVHNRKAHTS